MDTTGQKKSVTGILKILLNIHVPKSALSFWNDDTPTDYLRELWPFT
jgi:hypothetical protein